MFKHILLTTAFAGRVLGASDPTDYSEYGANWGKSFSDCNGDYQSPINLQTAWPKTSYAADKFFKHYEDFDTSTISWKSGGYTTVIGLPDADPITGGRPNYFTSAYSNITQEFKGAQFHFHARSEHTINSQQFDFEMHTVHLLDEKKDGYFAGVQGIIFDSKNYDPSVTVEETKIIDAFFDSLKLDQLDPDNNKITL